MPTGRESSEIKKSMAYNLITIIEENPEQETYTADGNDSVPVILRNFISKNLISFCKKPGKILRESEAMTRGTE